MARRFGFRVKHLGSRRDPYLDRVVLLSTPRFGVYLHRIWREDRDPFPHDHPWPFVSVILRGGYDEERHADPRSGRPPVLRRRRAGSVYAIGINEAHRIGQVKARTTTLVFRGRRRPDDMWGFYVGALDGTRIFVPWRQYLGVAEPWA